MLSDGRTLPKRMRWRPKGNCTDFFGACAAYRFPYGGDGVGGGNHLLIENGDKVADESGAPAITATRDLSPRDRIAGRPPKRVKMRGACAARRGPACVYSYLVSRFPQNGEFIIRIRKSTWWVGGLAEFSICPFGGLAKLRSPRIGGRATTAGRNAICHGLGGEPRSR